MSDWSPLGSRSPLLQIFQVWLECVQLWKPLYWHGMFKQLGLGFYYIGLKTAFLISWFWFCSLKWPRICPTPCDRVEKRLGIAQESVLACMSETLVGKGRAVYVTFPNFSSPCLFSTSTEPTISRHYPWLQSTSFFRQSWITQCFLDMISSLL